MSNEKFTFFWSGVFSQWQPSRFTVDDVEFLCAEQYMMYKKAELFGDQRMMKKIMSTTSPREQKAYGRKVKGFIKEEWDSIAKEVVFIANYAKFTQNRDLLPYLLATAGTTLVEASPVDKIWGIGLKADDPRAQNHETWLGTNWLGEVLTEVREIIIKNENESN